MSRRFGPQLIRALGAAAGVVVLGGGCIEPDRTKPDAVADIETSDADGTADVVEVADADIPDDVPMIDIIEPECTTAAHCTGETPDVCQAWFCEDNKCVVAPIDNDDRCETDDPCSPRSCVQGACQAEPLDDGESCDNDVFCDGVALCKAGVCTEGTDPCAIAPSATSCIASYACNEDEDDCDPVYRGPDIETYLGNGLLSTESCGTDGTGLCVDKRCVPDDMRLVPEGVFRMGCDASGIEMDPACESNAQPIHPVFVSTFAAGRFEATWAQWESCVAAGDCEKSTIQAQRATTEGDVGMPVSYLTYEQADSLCTHLGRRLCTEAEWEKAARGTRPTVTITEAWNTFPWGNTTPTCDRANAFVACGLAPKVVDSAPTGASYYKMLNMAGNVAEWVDDVYDAKAYSGRSLSEPEMNPHILQGGTLRVLRGGHYENVSEGELKTFRREAVEPNASLTTPSTWRRGVRCCATIPVDSPSE